MFKTASLIVLLALAACSGMPPRISHGGSPCQADPGGYQCEVQRYMNAG